MKTKVLKWLEYGSKSSKALIRVLCCMLQERSYNSHFPKGTQSLRWRNVHVMLMLSTAVHSTDSRCLKVQCRSHESGDLSARLACECGVWVARRARSAVTWRSLSREAVQTEYSESGRECKRRNQTSLCKVNDSFHVLGRKKKNDGLEGKNRNIS